MNKDQKLLEEAYQSIYESVAKEPAYFGPKEDKQKWFEWLKKLKHKVNEDGSLSTKGSVELGYKSLQRLPFNFKTVEENFYCNCNNLTSLEGAPETVGGDFFCSDNNLTSLEGAPKFVGGSFYCNGCNLTSLQGAPEKVKEFASDRFSDEDYRKYLERRKKVNKELSDTFSEQDLKALEDF